MVLQTFMVIVMDSLWFWLANIAAFVGILSALFSAINTYKIKRDLKTTREREAQSIKIRLRLQVDDENKLLELPVQVRRGDLTRAELMGILGTLPISQELKVPQPRYQLSYLSTPAVLQQIEDLRESENDLVLTIPCSQAEFEQFDEERIKALHPGVSHA